LDGPPIRLLELGDGNVELLEHIMGCTRDEARAIFESEPVSPSQFRTSREKAPRPAAAR
jgi:hypothetical protein